MICFGSLFLLASCGKDSELIDRAKNSALNNSITFSQALENTPYCEDSKWSTEQDDRGRDVVVHKCHIEVSKEQIRAYFQANQVNLESAKIYTYLNDVESTLKLTRMDLERGIVAGIPIERDSYLQNIERRIGATTYEQAASTIQDMQNQLDSDISMLQQILNEYNDEILALAPKHDLEVERITKIVFLPNSIDWRAPAFYSEELEKSFQSDPFSVAVRDIEGRRSSVDTKTTIFDLINKGLFQLSTQYDVQSPKFKDFVSSKCGEDGCPLGIMMTHEGWQAFFNGDKR